MLFGYGESLEKKTTEILGECEKLIDVSVKASGVSIMDAMSGLDAETGAMVGAAMKIYKKSKDLAVMQAKAMDQMLVNFEELKKTNEELHKQNDGIRQVLSNLRRDIENINK